jgi:hypothetical protein
MNQIARCREKIKELKAEIKILERLPSGDLADVTISNIKDIKKNYDVYAWLSYHPRLGKDTPHKFTFKRLEQIGFEHHTPFLAKWNSYRPSPCTQDLDTASRSGYTLTESWPMCPVWVELHGSYNTAVAFYWWDDKLYRVSVEMPPRPRIMASRIERHGAWAYDTRRVRLEPDDCWLTLNIDGVSVAQRHVMSYWTAREQYTEGRIYWEYNDDVDLKPSTILEYIWEN